MLTWCATAALKESFQTFPDLLIRRYSWDDHRNSCKSTCCSCRMPFHMHSLMSLDGLLRCQTSAADLIGTCACAQEVQFKWILVADLGFSWHVSTPVTFEMHLSRRAHGHFSGRSKQIHFFSRWMFISDRDGIINLHQVPTSQQAADIDDNRPMALPWPFFSVLRRLYQHRLRPGLSLPTLLLYSA